MEERRQRYFFALGELSAKRLQILLVKSHRTHFHGAVDVDQKERGHISQAVSVGDHVAIFVVDNYWKCYLILPGEFGCRPSVVLRNTQKGYGMDSVVFVE